MFSAIKFLLIIKLTYVKCHIIILLNISIYIIS